MNPENKNCQNCKNQFTIEPEDFDFYKKIDVPPPTWCPECRMQRRMSFRNERSLYKRACTKCSKAIIAIYPSETTFPVYCYQCWWSDEWDPLDFGIEFNDSRSFFDQVKELKLKVPRLQTANAVESRLINSDYNNSAIDLKNCYLTFASIQNEDCMYANYIRESRACVDMLNCVKSENSYDCFDVTGCYNVQFSQSCIECRDSSFLYDCRNCSNCIGCVGLRNQQYCIFNKRYSREEYEKEKAKLNLHTHEGIQRMHKRVSELKLSFPRKYYHGYKNHHFNGDYVWNTESVKNVFYTADARNVKHSFWCYGAEDTYDYIAWGGVKLSYELVECGDNVYGTKFCHQSWSETRNLEYCDFCLTSSECFGCVGLRNKSYCILNKQYTKDEYFDIKSKIIEQMRRMPYQDAKGRRYQYGEFFPIELSPYAYNDTIAIEHFPLRETQAEEEGYSWMKETNKNPVITIESVDLPEDIESVNDDILDKIIRCEHNGECRDRCTIGFRITSQELQFYRKLNLPLPHACHNCRHAERIQHRNPLRLWSRQCMCDYQIYQNTTQHPHHPEGQCVNTFQTSYAPDRPEIVYCEACYQAEVV